MPHADRHPLAVIGPSSAIQTGGIALFSTQLVAALSQTRSVEHWTWSRAYPGRRKRVEGDGPGGRPALDVCSPRSWSEVGAAIDRTGPGAVVINWVHPIQAFAVRAVVRALKGRNVWAICHNVKPHEGFPAWRSLTRAALAECAGIVVHSDGPMSEAKELFPGKQVSKLFLPPLLAAQADSELPPAGGKFRLLFFGHVRPYKGLEALLEAFRQFHDTFSNSELLIAGSPVSGSPLPGASRRYVTKLHSLVGDLRLEHAVRMRLEYLDENELRQLFRTTHAAVFPFVAVSSSASIITALAMGLPVAASRLPGLSDYVVEGENGVLASPGDPADLARALFALHRNLPERAAVKESVAPYSWESYCRGLLGHLGC